METNEIMPTVTPSWPEFASGAAANGTYMLTANYAVVGTLSLNANITIVFAGGRFTGGGTINGNNSTFVAPPVPVFDTTINFSGTWKMEKVYAENFGDTNVANAAPVINKALGFSNISGCTVQLLGKTYTVTQTINILGSTTLEGTICAPSYISDSAVSKTGTKIEMLASVLLINILTNGNTSGSIDCYRFVLRNLALYTTGAGDIINITANGTLSPRHGILENLIISHYNSNPGYSVKIAGGSYIRLERIAVTGGKGFLLANPTNPSAFQEFIWMRQIAFNSTYSAYPNPPSNIEINQGNHIYLTEIDVNDAQIGILLKTAQPGRSIHNVYMQKITAIRCYKAFSFNANYEYMGKIKVLDSSIFLKNTNGSVAFEFLKTGSYNISDSVFDTTNIDKEGGSGHYTITDANTGVINCRFLNFRIPSGETYNCTLKGGTRNNELNFVNVQKSNTVTASGSGVTRTVNLVSNYSPFPAKPVVVVSTNQKIPFSVATTNTTGGACQLQLEFASTPSGTVYVSYYLTGFYE